MAKLTFPTCPMCRNNQHTKVKLTTTNNGVIGPGYHSQVTSFIFYCEIHAIAFVDIRKEASANFSDYRDPTRSDPEEDEGKYLEDIKGKLNL